MAVIDPVFKITPNPTDGIRRSSDPQGDLGFFIIFPGELTVSGQDVPAFGAGPIDLVVSPGMLQAVGQQTTINTRYQFTPGQLVVEGMFSGPALPIATCGNLGVSDGAGYVITGTTHNITPATTIAQVNALSLSPGDAVLFQAGGTWTITTYLDRLATRPGVLYGRYGVGANPHIIANASDWPTSGAGNFFRGVIDSQSVSNITWDGIDVSNTSAQARGVCIFFYNCANCTISRCTAFDGVAGGIQYVDGTDVTIEYCVVDDVGSNPNETMTISGTNGAIVRYNRTGNSSHAALIFKGGTSNFEAYGNEITGANTDPNLYIETAQNGSIHHNWIHSDYVGGQDDVAIAVSMEGWVSQENRYNENIEIHNNLVEDKSHNGFRLNIINTAGSGPTLRPIHKNIHFHHNTLYNVSQDGEAFFNPLQLIDSRTVKDSADFEQIIVENNIFWANGVTKNFDNNGNIVSAGELTYRNNLHQTGVSGDTGTAPIVTSIAPFESLGSRNFDPAGPAVGAGHDGSDVGATVNWTCGI